MQNNLTSAQQKSLEKCNTLYKCFHSKIGTFYKYRRIIGELIEWKFFMGKPFIVNARNEYYDENLRPHPIAKEIQKAINHNFENYKQQPETNEAILAKFVLMGNKIDRKCLIYSQLERIKNKVKESENLKFINEIEEKLETILGKKNDRI